MGLGLILALARMGCLRTFGKRSVTSPVVQTAPLLQSRFLGWEVRYEKQPPLPPVGVVLLLLCAAAHVALPSRLSWLVGQRSAAPPCACIIASSCCTRISAEEIMSKLNPTIHQQDGVSAQTFAASSGLSVVKVLSMCRRGRIIGARQHHLTKRWWIYPPAKLVLGRWS